MYPPEGPSTQYLRTLVPKTIEGMGFGTRVLRFWLLGPLGPKPKPETYNLKPQDR